MHADVIENTAKKYAGELYPYGCQVSARHFVGATVGLKNDHPLHLCLRNYSDALVHLLKLGWGGHLSPAQITLSGEIGHYPDAYKIILSICDFNRLKKSLNDTFKFCQNNLQDQIFTSRKLLWKLSPRFSSWKRRPLFESTEDKRQSISLISQETPPAVDEEWGRIPPTWQLSLRFALPNRHWRIWIGGSWEFVLIAERWGNGPFITLMEEYWLWCRSARLQ